MLCKRPLFLSGHAALSASAKRKMFTLLGCRNTVMSSKDYILKKPIAMEKIDADSVHPSQVFVSRAQSTVVQKFYLTARL